MEISNISIAPSTCSHIVVTATVAGQVRTIHLLTDELQLQPGEIREAVISRLRSFKLENNYTNAQVRANLAGKVFHI